MSRIESPAVFVPPSFQAPAPPPEEIFAECDPYEDYVELECEVSTRTSIDDLSSSEGFLLLNETHRALMLDVAERSPSNSMLPEELQVLASSPAFRYLDDAVKTTVIEQMGEKLSDEELEATLDLATSPGFGRLANDEKQLLLRYTGGTNPQISGQARDELQVLLADPNYLTATPGAQTTQLQAFLTDQPRADRVLTPRSGELDPVRGTYTISSPSDAPLHDFRNGASDATRYDVEVEGQIIPVYITKNPPAVGHVHTIDQVAQGLADLPASSRAVIARVDLEPGPNPTAPPGDPSYMTAGADGMIAFYPTQHAHGQGSLEGALLHETGHAMSMKAWGSETSDPRWDPWKKAMESDTIRASPYAGTDAREDFAESLKLYYMVAGTEHEAEVRALMPERFRLIEDLAGTPAGTPPN